MAFSSCRGLLGSSAVQILQLNRIDLQWAMLESLLVRRIVILTRLQPLFRPRLSQT
jgi:hypothetical protein